jgi:hypothetical protein
MLQYIIRNICVTSDYEMTHSEDKFRGDTLIGRKVCGTGRQCLTIKWRSFLLRVLKFQVTIGGR